MMRTCLDCGRIYDDNHISTVCPHKGIGFCVACDCVICVCDHSTTNPRSNHYNADQAQAG